MLKLLISLVLSVGLFLPVSLCGQEYRTSLPKNKAFADPISLEKAADAFSRNKEWRRAAACYASLTAALPENAQYQYKFGGALAMLAQKSTMLSALGMVGDIEKAFLAAIRLDPTHINARWALVELYLQLPGIFGGSEKKAMRYASELQNLSNVDGYLAKGRISEYFERLADAEKWYLKAFEAGHSKACCDKLVSLYEKMHRPKEAAAIKEDYETRKAVNASAANSQIN